MRLPNAAGARVRGSGPKREGTGTGVPKVSHVAHERLEAVAAKWRLATQHLNLTKPRSGGGAGVFARGRENVRKVIASTPACARARLACVGDTGRGPCEPDDRVRARL
eukprot:6195793-Pleurochrysis_carterae.AAC.2